MRIALATLALLLATIAAAEPRYTRDDLPKTCPAHSTCMRSVLLEQCYKTAKLSIEMHFLLKGTDLLLDEMKERVSGFARGLSRSELSVEKQRKLHSLDEMVIAGDLEECASLVDGYRRLAKMRDDERRQSRGTWDTTISTVAPALGAVGETAQVLVAHIEIKLGHIVGPGSFRWQAWPEAALNNDHITRDKRPSAANELMGSVAREPMQPGDPVYSRNLTVRLGPTP